MDASKIQHVFFNLLETVINHKTENMYKVVLDKIREFIDADFIGLLIHYKNSSSFHVIESVPANREFELVSHLPVVCKKHEADFFINDIDRNQVQSIPLRLATNEELLLLIVRESRLSEENLSILQEESEKLLMIVNEMDKSAQRSRNNKFLLDLSTKFMRTNDKHIILREIVHAFRRIYPDFLFSLVLPQEDKGGEDLPIKILEYSDKGSIHPSTEVFMSGKFKFEVDDKKAEKMIYAPLIGEQSVYGVLEIIAPSKNYFLDEELEFISEFAILAGKALEQTSLYEDSLMQISNLTFLNEVIHELNSSREVSGIMNLIKNKLIRISKASQVGLITIEEESDVDFKIFPGSTAFFNEEEGYDLVGEIKKIVIERSEPIISGNYTEVDLGQYHSIMVFPMFHSGVNMGFILALSEEKYHFTFEAFKLIKDLIKHSSLAIANTILKEKLETAVITDFLTRLYSRNYLENKIDEHLQKKTKGVFLLYDIDDFKAVNDQFGHHIGDRVLKQVSQVFKTEVSDKGIAARWGGEELAIYLPEADLESGRQLAERVREAVAMVTEPRVTISCGVSYWAEDYNNSRKELFLQADEALYQAKSAGKNQVLIFS